MTNQIKEPIYDEKVQKIIHELKMGKSREQIAKDFGYKSYKSFDTYMSKRHLKWNPHLQNYEPKKATYQPNAATNMPGTKRIRGILNSFQKGNNSKEVAKQYGFKSHAELGNFMKEKGYEWNSEQKNYTNIVGKNVKENTSLHHIKTIEKKHSDKLMKQVNSHDEEFQEVMHLLVQYKDRLMEILNITQQSNQIPRYMLPGIGVTKSFHMSYELTVLLKQFCDERNVKQKEILECALIELLKKYGYDAEVKQQFNC